MSKKIRNGQNLIDAIQLHKSGNLAQAIPLYKYFLKHNPKNAEALHFFGILQSQLGNYEDSIHLISKAFEIQKRIKRYDINYINMANNLGNALRSAGKLEESIKSYNEALKLQPDNALVLNNAGIAYKNLGDFTKANRCLKKAVLNEPLYIEAIVNMGTLCRETGKLAEAIECFRKALAVDNNNAVAHSNLALALLSSGNLEDGWSEYEYRWRGNQWPPRPFDFPVWEGESLNGKTLLVFAEQGIGDEIMFASCIPDLVQRGVNVIVECDPRLEKLFRRSFQSVQSIGKNRDIKNLEWLNDFPAVDRQISIGSLPKLLRPNLDSFSAHAGYLIASEESVDKWKSRYEKLGYGLNVGISWNGGRSIADKNIRSISLNHWSSILNTQGINFINLQYGVTIEELAVIEAKNSIVIHDWKDSNPVSDIDDFASKIKALDLVISIDNSTVHMAGSLGVDTWVLQAVGGDWRWVHNKPDSYWYPAVENFWQTIPNEWGSVMQIIAERLKLKNQQ